MLFRSQLQYNMAWRYGGACAAISGGQVTLDKCLVAQNLAALAREWNVNDAAAMGGGGLYVADNGTLVSRLRCVCVRV